jgi:tetratricopeptide (TPR) repeat protein
MNATSRPRLSLCMIVRDSARTLPACRASIRPWVDEMIVVDTGSVDETRQIALDHGARVFEFPWIDDFSAARNESLRHARGEWLFWMDSDDTIDEMNGRGLQAIACSHHDAQVLGHVVQVHCPAIDTDGFAHTTVVDHVKLLRNHPHIRFEGRIHEQVLPAIRKLGGQVDWTDLYVLHSGSDQSPEGRKRKIDRDLRILNLDLAERPDHPFVLFNLGMTYEDIGEHERAEQWLRHCLEASAPNESHVRKAYALLAGCLSNQRHLEDARMVCHQGLAIYPDDKELLFRQATLAQALGNLDEAIAAYRATLQNGAQRHFTSIDAGICGFKAHHNLATALTQRGRHDVAEVEFRNALCQAPFFRAAWLGLAQALLDQRRYVAAELLAEENEEGGINVSDSHWLRAELALIRGGNHPCLELLERSLEIDSENLVARRRYCQVLFEHQGPASSVSELEELVRRIPEDAAAHHNLGVAYAAQDRHSEAISSFENSLRIRPNWKPTLDELDRQKAVDIVRPDHLLGMNIYNACAGSVPPSPSLMMFPQCAARHSIQGESTAFYCLHPRVHARGQRVTPEMCASCKLWSKIPKKLRPVPTQFVGRPSKHGRCAYLGEEIGVRECRSCRGRVQVKVFACQHPCHEQTTLTECAKCADYAGENVSSGSVLNKRA